MKISVFKNIHNGIEQTVLNIIYPDGFNSSFHFITQAVDGKKYDLNTQIDVIMDALIRLRGLKTITEEVQVLYDDKTNT